VSQPRASASTPRRRLHVDERRQLMIEAAQRLFSTRTVDEVSVDDIAGESGASRALLYHYCASKQDRYVAALREAADELVAQVTSVDDQVVDPLARLAVSVHAYVDYASAHATGFMTLLRGGPGAAEGEVGAVVQSVRNALYTRLLAGLGAANPRPITAVTLRAWIAVVETAALHWLEHPELERTELEAYLVQALPALLGAAEQVRAGGS
jgi:AcrR family transcriptional regulator